MSYDSFQTELDPYIDRANSEPWLVALLSTVFPGLGQIYAGRVKIGCLFVGLALVVIGAIAHSMLSETGSVKFAVQLGLGYAGLWLWNLVNAYRGTCRTNEADFERRRKESKDPWLAVFLSNLLPGLGHLYQGAWLFAIIFFVSIVGLRFLSVAVPLAAVVSAVLLVVCLFHVYVSSPTERETSRELIVNVCWFLLAANVLSLILALSLRTFVAEARYIPSEAMMPTLQVDDRLIINKLHYRAEQPTRGDVITFYAPQAALDASFSTTNDVYIKRVIGLPGETIEVKEGQVFVNGDVLEESYLEESDVRSPIDYVWGPEVVPSDAYFVLGDNRNNSLDSHIWGFLPAENIIGKATKIFWPPERQGNIVK